MTPDNIKLKLLFGLFEADASGLVAIIAAVVIFALFGLGRYAKLW